MNGVGWAKTTLDLIWKLQEATRRYETLGEAIWPQKWMDG